MNRDKKSLQILFLIIFLTSTIFIITRVGAKPLPVPFTVIQNPEETTLAISTPLNITLINNQLLGIDSVNLYSCSLEPNFVCYFPSLQLEEISLGFYNIIFTPNWTESTLIGYHLKIVLINSSVVDIPNESDNFGSENIQLAGDNLYYFTLQFMPSLVTSTSSVEPSSTSGFKFLV
ncbi:MAG: hypothetical protein ACXAB2_08440, partial [Candidatus Hodarchaeales archaeon]